jgi:hypothetical protein
MSVDAERAARWLPAARGGPGSGLRVRGEDPAFAPGWTADRSKESAVTTTGSLSDPGYGDVRCLELRAFQLTSPLRLERRAIQDRGDTGPGGRAPDARPRATRGAGTNP